MTSPRRILAVDTDALALSALHEHLTEAGFQFDGLREPTKVVPKAMAYEPHLIIMDRNLPILNGAEVLRSLRAFPQTSGIPVAFLVSDHDEAEVLRSLRSGAVDVMVKPFTAAHVDRVKALLDELASHPLPQKAEELLIRNLLGVYRRSRRTGALRVNPGTPFEGRAGFQDGTLTSAEFGPVHGLEALREMLQLEGGLWRFDGDEDQSPSRVKTDPAGRPAIVTPPRPMAAAFFPKVLVVDDDLELRRLFKAQLGRAGFEVDVAEDGIKGSELARAKPYDLIIADLNMPRQDGWGMLKALREDHRTREVPVVFLSAHDDYRETLKAAHSGAQDYLAKTGRSDVVVQRAQALVRPRADALGALTLQQPITVSGNLLGLQWLMRTLATLRCTGVLSVRDEWGQYTLQLKEGRPLDASATWPKRQATGLPAVAALLVARGAEGTFRFGPVGDTQRITLPMDQLIGRTTEMLNGLESRVTASRLAGTGSFLVDEVLYELFRQVGSDQGVLLARAVCEEKVRPAELPAKLGMTAEAVQEGLRELLRRGVISFTEPA